MNHLESVLKALGSKEVRVRTPLPLMRLSLVGTYLREEDEETCQKVHRR